MSVYMLTKKASDHFIFAVSIRMACHMYIIGKTMHTAGFDIFYLFI